MTKIEILIIDDIDGQWIMKAHPDLTPEQWRRVGERLVASTINFIETGDDEGPNIPA